MKEISIIPQPQSITILDGKTNLSHMSSIIIASGKKEEKDIGLLFEKLLNKKYDIKLTVKSIPVKKTITISLDKTYDIKDEGYELIIKDNSIKLFATTYGGLFYGYQSFYQILKTEYSPDNDISDELSNCKIIDYPKFGYRGMHLDVSRHFFDVTFIKTYIDMIALHKMNVFHWHLTDDNGWRIQIEKYPELTKTAAWRVDRTSEYWKEQSPIQQDEKATYGGYYSKEEIKEVIDYASKKNIRIIPEIEMPGHTSEVFSCYPELSCNGNRLDVQPGTYWPGVDIFCAGNDNVFKFLENILDEIIELFPGEYIHIGGDEADKKFWKECVKCQSRIKKENLKNEDHLQSWFIKKIEKYILEKNKKLVGWDEILEGGLAKSATVMSWRGYEGGIESAKSGHDVIMCPVSHCYFDYYQADPKISPKAFDGYINLEKVYSFNPVPKELNEDEMKHIIGGQGNLWTEFVQNPKMVQYRVLPRMTALSEVLWSGPGENSYEDFLKRLDILMLEFEKLNWNCAPHSFEPYTPMK